MSSNFSVGATNRFDWNLFHELFFCILGLSKLWTAETGNALILKKVLQCISPIVPAVGPPKIGTLADLALNPILLLDKAVEVDGGHLEDRRRVLEDPQSLRDGRRVRGHPGK